MNEVYKNLERKVLLWEDLDLAIIWIILAQHKVLIVPTLLGASGESE